MTEPPDVRSCCRSASGVASAWNALRRLPAADPWFWLVRSSTPGGGSKTGQSGAFAPWPTPAIGLVLLDGLPRLLGAFGAGVIGHG